MRNKAESILFQIYFCKIFSRNILFYTFYDISTFTDISIFTDISTLFRFIFSHSRFQSLKINQRYIKSGLT